MHTSAETLDDLMRPVLQELIAQEERVTASRGPFSELIGVLLELQNPRARLSHTERKGTIYSCIGEWLWYLRKTDKLDVIEYYLPRYAADSEDGQTLPGAYGPRLFQQRGHDQYANVIRLLTEKPTTRRAVIQLFNAEDISQDRKEIPCTCFLQFLLRKDAIHLVTSLRSNDAFRGLPHDIFAFTMIQEMVAATLGCNIGTYKHFVGSLHLYDSDRSAVTQYLDEGWQPTRNIEMPHMPSGDPWRGIESLLQAECDIREGRNLGVTPIGLEPYWLDIVQLLQVLRLDRDTENEKIPEIRSRMNHRVYDEYIARRIK